MAQTAFAKLGFMTMEQAWIASNAPTSVQTALMGRSVSSVPTAPETLVITANAKTGTTTWEPTQPANYVDLSAKRALPSVFASAAFNLFILGFSQLTSAYASRATTNKQAISYASNVTTAVKLAMEGHSLTARSAGS